MITFVAIFLGGIVLVLWWDIRRTRRLLHELSDAVRSERCLLLADSSRRMKWHGLEALVRETNLLVERSRRYSEANSGYSHQVEAILGSVQEAVFLFDGQHVIEFANESAQNLFQGGRVLRGARLESVVRSSSLLEFLEANRESRSSQLRQVSIDQRGQMLWFEASCARVQGVSEPESVSTLLVLHDITQLKRLEMVRREFVANVSHELRTPLTIIKGFAETLKEDNATLPEDTRARFIDKIVNNAQRLHVLVEDLLTLSRLESKPDQIEPVVQSLCGVMEDVAESARSRVERSEQQVVLEIDAQIGDFAFDRFRIQQVLDNLVENVFRYAPEFGVLVLSAQLSADGQFVECRVRDDGPGISAKDLPHIFERFYRVDKGRSRERGGTGLGLSIMKHIVQSHGGRVAAESELGKGTAICFTLPYRDVVSEAGGGVHS